MGTHFGWGIFLVLLGGLLNGSFYAPAKRMPLWRWENTWLIYSIFGMLVLPWGLAWTALPHLASVYHETPWPILILIAAFGLGWGIGSVFFGLGVAKVGIALGFGIILGIIAIVGAIVPILVKDPTQLWTPQGHALLAGLALVILGTIFCALAGSQRDKDKRASSPIGARSGFVLGFIICILSGIFSPMLNFSFVFGKDLQARSLAAGAAFSMASYSIWAVALTAGFCANAIYCIYLLIKNKTSGVYRTSGAPAGYWPLAALMGFLWFGGIAAYGMGATELGSLGGALGWPLFVATNIITGNVWGAVTGEWTGAGRRSYTYAYAGIGVLVVAIFVIAHGGAA
jgi:L-rhamnose-H+ transport protein